MRLTSRHAERIVALSAPQVQKWQWLSSLVDSDSNRTRVSRDLVMLADSDIVVQCTAEEIAERFRNLQARHGASTVLSAEREMWPHVEAPRRILKGPSAGQVVWEPMLRTFWPFVSPQPKRGSFHRPNRPNGGLVMGTREGVLDVWRAMRNIPTYPCCPAAAYGSDEARFMIPTCSKCANRTVKRPACAVSSQACLQVALLHSGRLARNRTGGDRAVIDENSSLFMSMYGVAGGEVDLDPDGRIRSKLTGEVPCVLHFNGGRSPAHSRLLNGTAMSRAVWVPRLPLSGGHSGWIRWKSF